MLLTKVFDKPVCLILRVDHQRPPSGVIDNDTVLNANSVTRKPCYLPLLQLDLVTQRLCHRDFLSVHDVEFVQLFKPVCLEAFAVLTGERACIPNHTC